MIDSAKAAANRAAREERKKAYLRGMMNRYAELFRATGNEDAPSVAREAHAEIDALLDRDRAKSPNGGDIQCRKGCSHCCHGPVEIWPHEAKLLIGAARASSIEMDRARLERQSQRTLDDWRQQPWADTACVFLGDDGACRVYESRPNACRKLLVTSDPELCDARRHPPERVERWFSWEAEILETAAQEVFGGGLMPRLLLTALKEG